MVGSLSTSSSLRDISPLGSPKSGGASPIPVAEPQDQVELGIENSSRPNWLPMLALAAGGVVALTGCGQAPPQNQVQVQQQPATPSQPLSQEALKTREDVLLRLHQIEGSQSDALSNFRLIEGSLRRDEDLGDAAQSFINLLQAVGRGNTGDAQAAYRTVSSSLAPEESRSQAVEQMLRLYRAEGSTSEAMSNYRLIQSRVETGANRSQSTDQFLRLLDQVGKGRTSDAQTMFRVLNPN